MTPTGTGHPWERRLVLLRCRQPGIGTALALCLLMIPLAACRPAVQQQDLVETDRGRDNGPPPDDGLSGEEISPLDGVDRDPDASLAEHDAAMANMIVSGGPVISDKKSYNLSIRLRGERLLEGATSDVWALKKRAFVGTFDSPCGDGTGDNESGIRIFDVRGEGEAEEAGFIPSVLGSRANDLKVAEMNGRWILVHSNELCAAGGRGGLEIWNVKDPTDPEHLASVQTDDVNGFLRDELGFVDFGVHNLYLITQGERHYVAAVVGSEFGNFQIFDITDPTSPKLAGFWGSEELRMAELGLDPSTVPDLGDAEFGVILDLDAWLFDGFGASRNRSLHDITISADGTKAYLSNWDAGLVLLDISDPTDPTLVSVAIDPVNGSRDGEVNSHAAWPNEDGTVVIETEEDFDVFSGEQILSNSTFGDVPTNTIPGVGISTNAGSDLELNPGNDVTVAATSIMVNSGPLAPTVYSAEEGAGTQPRIADTGPITGDAVFVGLGCDPLAEDLTGKIAIARRGACFFSDKLANAAAAGAAAIVIANNVPDSAWGGVRIWDYSDPANPELVSTFDTTCSAIPANSNCDPRGTYTAHNVIVERDRAYLSWYSDGVLVLDISDPANPVETARFHETGAEFESSNGGIQEVWGIYKDGPDIFASDRNGGLYVFRIGNAKP